MSLPDFCPTEYGGFPTITVISVSNCFVALSEFWWNKKLSLFNGFPVSSSIFSDNAKVSVKTMPSNGVYSVAPTKSWNASSMFTAAI